MARAAVPLVLAAFLAGPAVLSAVARSAGADGGGPAALPAGPAVLSAVAWGADGGGPAAPPAGPAVLSAVAWGAGADGGGPAAPPAGPAALPAGATTQAALSVWSGIYTAKQADRGAPLYEAHCGECHGPALEGGETAPPLAGADFQWAWSGLSVGDLFERLRVSMPEGRPRALTRAQKVDVLAYMLRENAFPAGDTELPGRASRLGAIAFEALEP